MKRILITGADGFLGSHLTDFCLNEGHTVIALKDPQDQIENLNHYLESSKHEEKKSTSYSKKKILLPTLNKHLKLIECDIRNAELLRSLILDCTPDLIFHFAAQPYVLQSWEYPRETIETNVIGTINLFEPIKKENLNTRVIAACSSAEYGSTAEKIKRPLKETDPLKAVHPYGISKIATELMGRQYHLNFGVDAINLRYFNQTGPRKTNDACSDFARKVAKIELGLQKPLLQVGNLDTFRDILSVEDSVRATWIAAKNGKSGKTYNVCSGRKVQIREILNTVLSFSSKEIEVQENTPELLRKTDEPIIRGDNSKLKGLGFEVSQTIPELLRDMYNYWIEFYQK
ncbi:MAG: GDP-mannose 4,6-dehydratase [Promethearchaeia archaeon]